MLVDVGGRGSLERNDSKPPSLMAYSLLQQSYITKIQHNQKSKFLNEFCCSFRVHTVHIVHPQATLYAQNIKEIPTESEWLCWVVDFFGSSYTATVAVYFMICRLPF